MDGAFDLMHFGHMNAFRLAKSLGTHLVVGVNSDESITKCKGAPLMNDKERLTMVEACKFVDQVVPVCIDDKGAGLSGLTDVSSATSDMKSLARIREVCAKILGP